MLYLCVAFSLSSCSWRSQCRMQPGRCSLLISPLNDCHAIIMSLHWLAENYRRLKNEHQWPTVIYCFVHMALKHHNYAAVIWDVPRVAWVRAVVQLTLYSPLQLMRLAPAYVTFIVLMHALNWQLSILMPFWPLFVHMSVSSVTRDRALVMLTKFNIVLQLTRFDNTTNWRLGCTDADQNFDQCDPSLVQTFVASTWFSQ